MLHEAPVLPHEDPEGGDALFHSTAKRLQPTDHLGGNSRYFCFSSFLLLFDPTPSVGSWANTHRQSQTIPPISETNVRLKICKDIVAVWKAELDKGPVKGHLFKIMWVKHIETMAGRFTLAKTIMIEALEASETIVKVAKV